MASGIRDQGSGQQEQCIHAHRYLSVCIPGELSHCAAKREADRYICRYIPTMLRPQWFESLSIPPSAPQYIGTYENRATRQPFSSNHVDLPSCRYIPSNTSMDRWRERKCLQSNYLHTYGVDTYSNVLHMCCSFPITWGVTEVMHGFPPPKIDPDHSSISRALSHSHSLSFFLFFFSSLLAPRRPL